MAQAPVALRVWRVQKALVLESCGCCPHQTLSGAPAAQGPQTGGFAVLSGMGGRRRWLSWESGTENVALSSSVGILKHSHAFKPHANVLGFAVCKFKPDFDYTLTYHRSLRVSSSSDRTFPNGVDWRSGLQHVVLTIFTVQWCSIRGCLSPTGCSEKPSLHCSCVRLFFRRNHLHRAPPVAFSPESSNFAFFLICCIGSPACPILSDVAMDTSSKITTKDLKEKKEVVEEAENGRDAPANGNTNEENGEQEADNEVDEEEEEGGEEEEEEEEGDGEEEDGDEDEEAEAATGKWAAEDDEDDDVNTKKQKTDEDD
ncbi:uncharacterized protein LOC125091483 [Lutra lutra]|uniref:uncharacterized protein LOC125091483 n=1 Tax=Lutra lutra TaxID=9657 RepID=UPI001FCF8E54|nr:uncharacterized protein LOC125091483 [Lutra lutra]